MRTHQDKTDKKIGDKKTKTMNLFFCRQSFCRSFLLTTLLAPLAMLQAEDAPKQKPNIILFLIDDLGWRDLGCQGSTFYQTPHIDQLAAEGVRFTDAYAACAVCSPTRAAVLTGKYPARLLLTEWLPSGRWNPKAKLQSGRFLRGLPVEEHTLAEALRDGGYRTAHIGKWHLGSEPFCLPEHHGFDLNIAGNAHGAPGSYFFPYPGDWLIPGSGQRATWNVLPDGKEGEYLTDRLTDEAVKFIRDTQATKNQEQRTRNKAQPFFLYFPHYGVHTPIQAKPEVTAKYERIPESQRQGKPEYAAMVESIDDSVGRVMATLKELHLDENTIVIFTSDNGGFYNATSNAPLRANKGAYYEGGIRVPLIIKWPGLAKPGLVVSEIPSPAPIFIRPASRLRDCPRCQISIRTASICGRCSPVKASWPRGRSSGTTRTTTNILRVSRAASSAKVRGNSSRPSTPRASNSTTSPTTSAKLRTSPAPKPRSWTNSAANSKPGAKTSEPR